MKKKLPSKVKFGKIGLLEKFLKPVNSTKITKSLKPKNPRKISLTSSLFFLIYIFSSASICYFSYQKYRSFIKQKITNSELIAEQIANEFDNFLSYSQLLLNLSNENILQLKSYGTDSAKVLSSLEKTRHRNSSSNNFAFEGILYWIDSNKYLIASSIGKIDKPLNLSSRDYLEKSQYNPWELQVGEPVIGALSGQMIIPIAVGALGEKGHHVGTSVLSVRIENLIDNFRHLSKKNIDEFAIFRDDKKLLLESNNLFFSDNQSFKNKFKKFQTDKTNKELFLKYSPLDKKSNLVVQKKLQNHDFYVFYSVSGSKIHKELKKEMLPYLLQLVSLNLLLLLFLLRSKSL